MPLYDLDCFCSFSHDVKPHNLPEQSGITNPEAETIFLMKKGQLETCARRVQAQPEKPQGRILPPVIGARS
jgi:hypothetical protein